MSITLSASKPDCVLIAAVDQCINLNAKYYAATEADTTDGEDPALQRADSDMAELALAIRQTPAQTLEGALAKAKVWFVLTDFGRDARGRSNFEGDEYPADPDLFGNSILHDLVTLGAIRTQ